MAIRLLLIGLTVLPLVSFAETDSMYCPQNHGYINLGMTQAQVLASCGEPTSKQESNQPVLQKVPVKQLMYNDQGQSETFYGPWALPIGNGNVSNLPNFRGKSNVGVNLEVNVIKEKVSSISVNGTNSNAFSICNNQNIEVGDPVSRVLNACGQPSLVNNTFIKQAIPSSTKPQIWIYQTDNYQAPFTLTFIDGKLQSIK